MLNSLAPYLPKPYPISKITHQTDISHLITRFIVIYVAPLAVLFCNCPLADLYLPAVKRY